MLDRLRRQPEILHPMRPGSPLADELRRDDTETIGSFARNAQQRLATQASQHRGSALLQLCLVYYLCAEAQLGNAYR